jgi:large subunit ribosomal protein L32
MAHPKSKISKQRKRTRRTHKVETIGQIDTCSVTGETHLRHRAYMHEGAMYYKGKVLIAAAEDED